MLKLIFGVTLLKLKTTVRVDLVKSGCVVNGQYDDTIDDGDVTYVLLPFSLTTGRYVAASSTFPTKGKLEPLKFMDPYA